MQGKQGENGQFSLTEHAPVHMQATQTHRLRLNQKCSFIPLLAEEKY